MMNDLTPILIGFLPAMLYCVLIYRWLADRAAVPPAQYILCLMAGFITAVPSYYLQQAIEPLLGADMTTWSDAIKVAFVSVSLIEELVKVVMIYIMVHWLAPKGLSDVIVVASAIGLGFAGVENILYSRDLGWEVGLFRSATAIPAHLCFAVFAVYFYAMSRSSGSWAGWIQGFGFAFVFHGLYDTFILQRVSEPALLIALAVLALCIFLAYRMVIQLSKRDTLHQEDIS